MQSKAPLEDRQAAMRQRMRGRKEPSRRSPLGRFAERFWERVQIGTDTECWPWMGKRRNGHGLPTEEGHGQVKTRQEVLEAGRRHEHNASAHRIAYYFVRGDIPAGLEPDHLCNNKPCCNPWHFELVTRAVNIARMHVRRWEGGNCAFVPGTAIVCTDLSAEERIGAMTT